MPPNAVWEILLQSLVLLLKLLVLLLQLLDLIVQPVSLILQLFSLVLHLGPRVVSREFKPFLISDVRRGACLWLLRVVHGPSAREAFSRSCCAQTGYFETQRRDRWKGCRVMVQGRREVEKISKPSKMIDLLDLKILTELSSDQYNLPL